MRKVNLMDDLSTVEEVMEHLSGAVIESGELTDDGLHITLTDQRIIVFIGDFVMGVLVADKRVMN